MVKYSEAIDSFDKAIAINPNDATVWKYRGIALGKLKKYTEALVSFDKVIAINSNDADAWRYRRIALSKLGKYSEAFNSFDKATDSFLERLLIPDDF